MKAISILLNWILWPCAMVLGMALVVSYCSVYINPAKTWIPAFFGLYFVPLVVANLLLCLVALLKRSSVAWIPFICLLPTLLFAELFVRWGTDQENRPGIALKVATYNVCNFQGYGKKPREETMKEISHFLNREQIDIICMQEFFCPDTSKLRELFPAFPYQCFSLKNSRNSYRGNVIFSRYPIKHTGELKFPDSFRSCIYADIELYGRSFRIYTTHLESNNISLNAIADHLRKYQEGSDEILRAHLRIREAFRVRAQQVETIADHLGKIETPLILCGDFNDTPISYTYHRLQMGLRDSFRHAGKGFGATFRFLWPTLRIDYVLYNSAFTAKSHKTVRVPFSDHYPVVTELLAL